MKTAILTAAAMILAIALLYRPFVALDQYSRDVGRMISGLTTSTDQVDQSGLVSGFYEILAVIPDSPDSRWEIILSGIVLLIVLVWSWNVSNDGSNSRASAERHRPDRSSSTI